MNTIESQCFLSEAHNIVRNHNYFLPDDVRIDVATSVWVNRPNPTVVEYEDGVRVLAWITIPKTYEFPFP